MQDYEPKYETYFNGDTVLFVKGDLRVELWIKGKSSEEVAKACAWVEAKMQFGD